MTAKVYFLLNDCRYWGTSLKMVALVQTLKGLGLCQSSHSLKIESLLVDVWDSSLTILNG